MANTNAPFGFRQYSGTGSAPTYEQVSVLIASTDTTACFFGDPVTPLTSGYVTRASSSSASGNTPIAGIFVGCQYLSVAQKRTVWSNYWPGSDVASTDTVTGYIINDPNAKFVAQFGNVAVDQGYVNSGVGFNIGTGSTTNGISGAYLATLATDNTMPFKVVSLVTDPPGVNGTAAGAYQKAIVAFNNVSTKQLTGV